MNLDSSTLHTTVPLTTDKRKRIRSSLERVTLQFFITLSIGVFFVFSQKLTIHDWLVANHIPTSMLLSNTWHHIAVIVLAALAVLAAPFSPLVAMSGCVLMANGFDRYSPQNIWNHYYGLNHTAALSVFIACLIKLRTEKHQQISSSPYHHYFILGYLVWICFTEAYHALFNQDSLRFPLRTWIHALPAVAFVEILSRVRLRKWEIETFAFVMAIPLCVRRYGLGENLFGNHDVPTYAVCAIPFLILVAAHGWIFKRLLSSMLIVAMVLMIIETNNRSGFIGLVFAVTGALMGISWKFLPAIAALVPGFFLFLKAVKPTFFERFSDILNNGPAADTVYSRITIYTVGLSLQPISYLAGVGIGRFGSKLLDARPELGSLNAHNTWLAVLTELGALGLVFYSLIMVNSIGISYKLAQQSDKTQRVIGLACFSAILGFCGFSIGMARDLFLPYYIIIGIAFSRYNNTVSSTEFASTALPAGFAGKEIEQHSVGAFPQKG
jgi:hypothetical protein